MGIKLSFKPRDGGRTVQLVQHIYCSERKRSKTVTVGSLRRDADPEDFDRALKLRPGVLLDDALRASLSAWLSAHGDSEAARSRDEQAARWRQRGRDELAAEMSGQSSDYFEQAEVAMSRLIQALPKIHAEELTLDEQGHARMRKQYLSVMKQSEQLMKAAQALGLAKKIRRGAV